MSAGSLYYYPEADPGTLPAEWRRRGRRLAFVRSVDAEFAGLGVVSVEDVLTGILDSLPPGARVELAVWLPSADESERTSVDIRPGAAALDRLDSIRVEVDRDGSGRDEDELRVYDVTDSERGHVIDTLVTSDSAVRQVRFAEMMRNAHPHQRLRVDLSSHGGIVGLVFDRDLLSALGADDVRIQISGVTGAAMQ